MDILTSPWFIITVVMAFLIGNIAAFRYFTPKNLDKFKPRNNEELDRLIELDKAHHTELHPTEHKQKSE